jgi:hypothetical protein
MLAASFRASLYVPFSRTNTNDGILCHALFHSCYRVWLRSVIPCFNELCRSTLLRLIYMF